MLDLFALADENRPRLDARWTELIQSRPNDSSRGALQNFQAVVRDARLSINMTSTKLRSFMERGEHINPYELARWRASVSGTDAEAELRSQQAEHYDRRVCFDRSFVRGEEFRYAALNLGGLGLNYYGGVCVVFSPKVFEDWRVAVVPGNSLDLYVTPASGARLDEAQLRYDVGAHDRRHTVAALKHADDDLTDETRWPSVLCDGNNSFIEAIFVGRATPALVEEIRVEAKVFDLAYDKLTTPDTPLEREQREERERIARVVASLPDSLASTLRVIDD